MHIYELGLSSVSLPANYDPFVSRDDTTMNEATTARSTANVQHHNQYHQQQQQQNRDKRSREVPSSPSPLPVVQQSPSQSHTDTTVGTSSMEVSTPLAKRQRHFLHGATTECQEWTMSVSPDHGSHNHSNLVNNRNSLASSGQATTIVSEEREGQYEWWRKPATAPPLLPSTTMTNGNHNDGSKNNPTSGVVGCYTCQRLFVPPPAHEPAVLEGHHNNHHVRTLLDYFPSSKSKTATRPPTAIPAKNSSCRCTFCERSTCNNCLRTCEHCQHAFCILCSTQAYRAGAIQEQTLCLDCASVLDMQQSSTKTTTVTQTTGDAMMEE